MFSQTLPTNKTAGSVSGTNNPPNQQMKLSQQQQNPMNQFGVVQPPVPPPFMDPYMYQMMLAAQYGYPPSMYAPSPFAYPPQMPFATRQNQQPDDMQSIQSFHFDMDNRSVKNLNIANKAQSVAGDYKADMNSLEHKQTTRGVGNQQAQQGLLLMEDPNKMGMNMMDDGGGGGGGAGGGGGSGVGGLIESSSHVKRDENRLTPLMHHKAHVRASFSLNGMVKIRANDPCEGQPALVDIINVGDLMDHYLNNLKNMKTSDCRIF
jgi:hypothetical protein